MDDPVWVMLVLAIVATVVVGIVMLANRMYDEARTAIERGKKRLLRCRKRMERRIAELWAEFPNMTDDEIATLARDELVNGHEDDPELFKWATSETAGRIRRTLALEVVRSSKASK